MAVQRIDPRVELFHDDQWNDVGNRVRGGKSSGFGVDISRGRSNETATVDPSQCNLQLNNQDGRFTPLNPNSPLFEKIGQNTPLRVFLGTQHVGAGVRVLTQESAHVAPSVDATKAGLLICAWFSTSADRDYTAPASMTEQAEVDGGDTTVMSATEVIPSAGPTGTRTATINLTSAYRAVSVLMHGDSVGIEEVLSGVRIFTDAIKSFTLTTGAGTQAGWWLVAFQAWAVGTQQRFRFPPDSPQDNDGGWILLADDLMGFEPGTRLRAWARRVTVPGEQAVTFTGDDRSNDMDNHGHLYVLSGVDFLTIRTVVEVSEWPVRWDQYGKNVFVPVEGSGILRRLGTGTKPALSALRRIITGPIISGLNAPFAYWPLEDGQDARVAASGLPDKPPMQTERISFSADAEPVFSGRSQVPAGSDSLPEMGADSPNLVGKVLGMSEIIGPGSSWIVSFLSSYESPNNYRVIEVSLSGGPAGFVSLQMQFRDTEIILFGFNSSGASTTIGSITTLLPVNDGLWRWVQLRSSELGGTVSHSLTLFDENGVQIGSATLFGGGTSGTSPGAITRVITRGLTLGNPVSIGHISVWASSSAVINGLELVHEAINGHFGETAGRRIERLCGEENVKLYPVGDLDQTAFVGSQRVVTFLDLLAECELADQGVLYEPREDIALAYRTLRSMFNQPATLAMDYEACHLGHPLDPTLDDQQLVNDVIASRTGGEGEGSSAQVVQETGPRGVQEAGRYDISREVNVASDLQLPDWASWRVHVGTVNEHRFPLIRIKNLNPPHCPLDPNLTEAGSALDIGDRLTIDNLPLWMPPDQVQALVQGYREHLDWYEWDLRLNTSPASPFTIGVRQEDDPDPGPADAVRRDTAGSELDTEFVAGTDTSFDVLTTLGPPWGVTGATNMHFPIDVYISGARVRVTGIAVAVGQVQTFTCEQAIVNGVNKTIPAGEPVRLWQPAVRGL